MLKENKGVTLVALVITIIVLLILAGVTLSMVVGNNGLFKKAKDSDAAMAAATAVEKVSLAVADAQADSYANNTEYSDAASVVTAVNLSLASEGDGYTLDTTGTAGAYPVKKDDKVVKTKDGSDLKATITVTSGVVKVAFNN